ncbi:MAG TPA: N-acetylmuramoyl-L-alanine amidase [Chthoniobacterales bacterium]|nr:N-acetylmuramoyl-L-alanine amidase [Chthoniobacterales bacterium]
MGRSGVWLFFALSAIIGTFFLQAQQTDEEKPIRKARAVTESDESPAPTASAKAKTSPHKKKKSETPSPTSTAKKKKSPAEDSEASATPRESPDATAKKKKSTAKESAATANKNNTPADDSEVSATPSETPEATAKKKKSGAKESPAKGKKKKKSPTPEKTPGAKKKHSPKPSETPEVEASPTVPRAIAVPSPSAPPSPSVTRGKSALAAPVEQPQEPEQLTIEKYGYEKPRGFWSRLFGGGRSSGSGAGYRYLTRSVKDQIDRAPVTRARWQFIVVHNSGTRQGNAAAFDYYHRHFRRMQNGLAYHFVIGNGTSTGNGQIEVGDRWRRQINGGHVHSDYLNNIALGICLVGDFNREQPTRAQLDCCEELIRYLRQRCGKIDNSHYPIVKPHREVNPPRWATDCPGNVFPYAWFRRFKE